MLNGVVSFFCGLPDHEEYRNWAYVAWVLSPYPGTWHKVGAPKMCPDGSDLYDEMQDEGCCFQPLPTWGASQGQ